MSGAQYVFIVGLPRTGTTSDAGDPQHFDAGRDSGASRNSCPTPRNEDERLVGPLPRSLSGEPATCARTKGLPTSLRSSTRRPRETTGAGSPRVWIVGTSKLACALRTALIVRCSALLWIHFANGKPIRGDKTPQHYSLGPPPARMVPGGSSDSYLPRSTSHPRVTAAKVAPRRPRRQSPAQRVPVLELYAATSLILRWQRVIALHRAISKLNFPDATCCSNSRTSSRIPGSAVERLCSHVQVETSPRPCWIRSC